MASLSRTPKSEPEGERVQLVFSVDELWLLQRYIRHEMPQQEQWKYPPANLEFNHTIAEAILFCARQRANEAALQLSMGDLLAIDYFVSQDVKDVNGKQVGRELLLKSYQARAALRTSIPGEDGVEPSDYPNKARVKQLLAERKETE